MKRILISTIALGLLLFLPSFGGNVSASAGKAGAVSFTSNGDQISGWHWLRSGGQSATWVFRTRDFAGASKVYLNFAPLVTNQAGGGSGFGTTVKVTIEGSRTMTMTIPATNPYMPQDPQGSGGLGYQCYGHSGMISPALYAGVNELRVTIQYPFPTGRHVAVSRDAMFVGFSR